MRQENKLDCKESQSLMTAYLDGELDSAGATRFDLHLRSCPACSEAIAEMRDLQKTLKTHATHHVAPSHLKYRIQTGIQAQLQAQMQAERLRPAARVSKFANLPWAWINFSVATACSLAFAVMFSLYVSAPSMQDRIEDEVVASHARSLMVAHLSDVVSTDQHTVKPWFAGKLDFSPTVYDFAQQGFPLVGGRLDYLDKRPVAAMAYHHRLHVINLFVWPETPHNETPPVSTSRQGYQLIHWTQSGMCYWIISDMNAQDLTEFKRLLTEQIDKNNAGA
jgi:anti-sigma factor (TIGR02949 family)